MKSSNENSTNNNKIESEENRLTPQSQLMQELDVIEKNFNDSQSLPWLCSALEKIILRDQERKIIKENFDVASRFYSLYDSAIERLFLERMDRDQKLFTDITDEEINSYFDPALQKTSPQGFTEIRKDSNLSGYFIILNIAHSKTSAEALLKIDRYLLVAEKLLKANNVHAFISILQILNNAAFFILRTSDEYVDDYHLSANSREMIRQFDLLTRLNNKELRKMAEEKPSIIFPLGIMDKDKTFILEGNTIDKAQKSTNEGINKQKFIDELIAKKIDDFKKMLENMKADENRSHKDNNIWATTDQQISESLGIPLESLHAPTTNLQDIVDNTAYKLTRNLKPQDTNSKRESSAILNTLKDLQSIKSPQDKVNFLKQKNADLKEQNQEIDLQLKKLNKQFKALKTQEKSLRESIKKSPTKENEDALKAVIKSLDNLSLKENDAKNLLEINSSFQEQFVQTTKPFTQSIKNSMADQEVKKIMDHVDTLSTSQKIVFLDFKFSFYKDKKNSSINKKILSAIVAKKKSLKLLEKNKSQSKQNVQEKPQLSRRGSSYFSKAPNIIKEEENEPKTKSHSHFEPVKQSHRHPLSKEQKSASSPDVPSLLSNLKKQHDDHDDVENNIIAPPNTPNSTLKHKAPPNSPAASRNFKSSPQLSKKMSVIGIFSSNENDNTPEADEPTVSDDFNKSRSESNNSHSLFNKANNKQSDDDSEKKSTSTPKKPAS